MRHGAQLSRVREEEARGGGDDEEEVEEADDVPNEDGAKPRGVVDRCERDGQRHGGDNDVADAGGNGEGAGQLAALVEPEEVNSDEARDVQEHDRAEVERVGPRAQRLDPKIGDERAGGEGEDERGNRAGRQALQEEEVSGRGGGGEPKPEDESDEKRSGHENEINAGAVRGRAWKGESGVSRLRPRL